MAGPEKKTVTASPGAQTVQVSPQVDFPVEAQKESAGFVSATSPPVSYFLGGDAPRFARFAIGALPRPKIVWDHGCLDSMDGKHNIDPRKLRAPTTTDYAWQTYWLAKLKLAKAFRPDLLDGTQAYHHYHYGNGALRRFNYDRYVVQDASGAKTLRYAVEDVIGAAVELHDYYLISYDGPPGTRENFVITSAAISTAGDRFPYPVTENWQKAIGGHSFWITASVKVNIDTGRNVREFFVTMTLDAEDRYNFDPGKQALISGEPDEDNGRFQVCELAREFDQRSTIIRNFSFEAPGNRVAVKHYLPPGLKISTIVRPDPFDVQIL